MDAGQLNTRLQVIRQVKTADGYGGNFSTEQVVKTIWAKKTEQSGNIGFEDGQRRHFIQTEFIIRKRLPKISWITISYKLKAKQTGIGSIQSMSI